YTILSWTPEVRAPSGAEYRVNGYINEDNYVERVETWLGENIMGDMHIVATYKDWMDFSGAVVPTRIVQTRGGWPFFEADVIAATANPADIASLAPAPEARGPGGFGGGPGGAAPGFEITKEQLGEGLFRYTTSGFS